MATRYLGWIPRFFRDDRTVLGIRYAYVALALLSVFVGLIAVLFGIQGRKANNHKFCEVIVPAVTALRTQIPKNASTSHDPRIEDLIAWLRRYEDLGRGLGC